MPTNLAAVAADVPSALDALENLLAQAQAAYAKQAAEIERLRVELCARDERAKAQFERLDDELHVVAQQRDEARRGCTTLSRQLEATRADYAALCDEVDSLTSLAQQAERGATMEERQLAASLLVARLVRPPVRQLDPEDAVIERAERECMEVS